MPRIMACCVCVCFIVIKPAGIIGAGFILCPSCQPTESVKAMKRIQNIDSNLGIILQYHVFTDSLSDFSQYTQFHI